MIIQARSKTQKMPQAEFPIDSIRKEMDQGPLFYRLEHAARILDVSYMTIYRLVTFGDIDAVKIAGIWRIPKQALVEYLEKRHPINMP
jgi:excisionase family DNA binding protein